MKQLNIIRTSKQEDVINVDEQNFIQSFIGNHTLVLCRDGKLLGFFVESSITVCDYYFIGHVYNQEGFVMFKDSFKTILEFLEYDFTIKQYGTKNKGEFYLVSLEELGKMITKL